jgi:pimeloyl-ACP methyl ester carboxylesterase
VVQQHQARRLTTILAADVVGYGRLMSADESATLAALKTHRRDLIEPKTAEHGGRLIKLMGDGALMEFVSVVYAVRFAVEVQRAMAECNGAVPEDRRIAFRIGINIGDVIVEDDDLYGDVLHCRDDAVQPFEAGRRMAAMIPGARFVALDGRNHLILETEPAWSRFLEDVEGFLGSAGPSGH